MAKIFLDTNFFIDAVHRKPERDLLQSLKGHIVYVSPLSLHIYCYIFDIKMPNLNVLAQMDKFRLVDLSETIAKKTLKGPTQDLEDNIQLHSTAAVDCDFFLTNDKKLLRLKFFGKATITPHLL